MPYLGVLFMVILPLSQAFSAIGLTNGQGNGAQIQDIVSRLKPGSVLVVGESHDNSDHAAQHIEILRILKAAGFKVGVGHEFVDFTEQNSLDAFRAGTLSEVDYLKAIGWGGYDFDNYRGPMLFDGGGEVRGLNAPRWLSSKLAKFGMAGLTADEKALFPPQFAKGSDAYYERFTVVMQDHLPTKEAIDRYFLAQSLWDDTMADQTVESLRRDPTQVFVIIVGEFHVQYGGGLPDRLRARGIRDVVTLSQIVEGDSSDVHPKYGERADWIWTTAAGN